MGGTILNMDVDDARPLVGNRREVQTKGRIMADETTTKKTGVCRKVYVSKDGTETRSATPNAERLEFRFTNGNTHAVVLKDHGPVVATCLGWFGISEKYGNAYAGAKGDADAGEELFLSMQEQLKGGTWVERAEGLGPRPSLIADAIIAALENSGETVDDKRTLAIREKVKDKDIRDGALKDPAIKAEYEAAKAKRAAERAKDAAAAAKGQTIAAKGF